LGYRRCLQLAGLGFHANYGEYKFTNINSVSGAEAKSTGYGLAVMYEIGEGISASAGYGNSDLEVDGEKANTDLWSLGLVMNF
jgi:predicted porin